MTPPPSPPPLHVFLSFFFHVRPDVENAAELAPAAYRAPPEKMTFSKRFIKKRRRRKENRTGSEKFKQEILMLYD